MNYWVIDREKYYRKGVYRHFTEDCKCSVSLTCRIDVTELVNYSKNRGTKFYLNFLYLITKVLNSRDDYRMNYLWQSDELVCYDQINPTQYVFHEDTETCTPVYTEYDPDYERFYAGALRGVGDATMPTVIMLVSFVAFRQVYLAVTRAVGAGFLAVALAYPVGWILCSTLLIIRYSRSALVRGNKPQTI